MRTLFANRTVTVAACIFILALVARVGLFAIDYHTNAYDLQQTIHGDDGYYELANGILAGRGFTWDTTPPFTPNPLRTPVYPYFMAALLYVAGSYWVAIGIQMLIGSASAALSFLIGEQLLSKRGWAAAIGVFMALEPYHMQFSSIFYTETLFVFLFLCFTWQWFRYLESPSVKNIVYAAVVLGIATLTKTTIQFLPIILGLFVLWYFRKNIRIGIAHAAILGVVFLAMISPWLYRNYVVYGVIGMSAQPAYNLIIYLVPSVLAVADGVPIAQNTFVQEHHIVESNITLATAREYTGQAIHILRQHPIALAQVGLLSGLTFFTHDGMLTVLQHAGYSQGARLSQPAIIMAITNPLGLVHEIRQRLTTPQGLVLLFRLINIVVAFYFVIGVWMLLKRNRLSALWVSVLIFIFYFLATTPINGLGVNARFRMPVEPLIVAVALVPGIALWEWWRHTGKHLSHEQAFDSHPLL